MFVLNIIDCFTNETIPVFALYCFYVVPRQSILAENVMGTARVTLGIVDYWSILVRFVPLLSRTNSWRSSTCIRFAPYLESAGRTASATLVLDRAHSSIIKSMLLKTQLRWVDHVVGMEEHCMS